MLRKAIRNIGLAGKFNLLVICLLVSSSSAITLLILRQWSQLEHQRLMDQGRLLAAFLAESTEPFLKNPKGFREFVDQFEPDRDIAYMCLVDAQGEIVAQKALRAQVPRLERKAGLAFPVRQLLSDDGQHELIEFRAPVWAYHEDLRHAQTDYQLAGYLHLGMGLENLQRHRSEFIHSIAIETVVIVVLGTLGSLLLVRRFTAPVKDLANATERISRGDFDHSIRIDSRDDLGHLAESFNRMLNHLRTYRDEVQEQKQSLEEQVDLRSRELKEVAQAATEAAFQAEEANRTKSRFLANMSHELRTPLNGVLGMSELLLASSLTPRQERLAQAVSESGQALLKLINSILDFARVEAGSLILEKSELQPEAILEKALASVSASAKAKGLDLASHVDPRLPDRLVGDPGRLAQVLNILLENAVKFSDHGQVQVRISPAEKREAPPDPTSEQPSRTWILFEVQDQGIGIAPQLQSQLFHSFSQLDGSTRRRFGGAGLGLAIAKQLTEKMGGEIGVESRPGQGARFWFCLPLPTQDLPCSAAAKPNVEDRNDNLYFPGAKILLAEDNATNQQLVLEMLKSLGCQVELADDGQKAVEAFAQEDFDLVLMDCQMPVLDGYEATCLMRSMEQSQTSGRSATRRTPIIALTANAMEGDREHCLATGMDDYIAKPFSSHQLHSKIQRWIAGCAPSQGSPAPQQAEASSNTADGISADQVGATLDMEALQQIQKLEKQGAKGLLQRLIQLFLQDAPAQFSKLDEASHSGDLGSIREAAHSLKSMAVNLGLIELADTAKQVENLARNGSSAIKLKQLEKRLRLEYPKAEDALLRLASMPAQTSELAS